MRIRRVLRILIIGGTSFVGRHITQAAIDAGHQVTLFHRGQTGADLFPQATHLNGDRDEDLSALRDGRWDATVDVIAYLPRQVESLAATLNGRGGHYLLISSVSVYRTPVAAGFTEDAPLAELDDPATQQVTAQTYGGLKVACERAALRFHGPVATTIIRPTYVVGPHDSSYRFTWWVERMARGGTILAPGDPADPIQVIDARDLAAWTVALAEKSAGGVFHAASPAPPFGFGDLLSTVAAEVAPAGTRLTWVDSDFLLTAGQDDESLPLWPGADSEHDINAADPAAALAAGLTPRPLRETVADVRAHQTRSPDTPPSRIGLSAAREAELLDRWAAGPT